MDEKQKQVEVLLVANKDDYRQSVTISTGIGGIPITTQGRIHHQEGTDDNMEFGVMEDKIEIRF